jgi:gamma-glutamyltranspeptidase
MLSNLIDHQMTVQEAIEAPRWLYGPLVPGDPPGALRLERRFDPRVPTELRRLGHPLTLVDGWSSSMGHAQAIVLQNGVYMGGADPRGDGYALAW